MSSSTTSMPGPSSGSQSSSNTLSSTAASTLNEDSSSQSRDSMSQQSSSESSSLTRPTTPSTSALNTSILTPNSTLPQTSSYSTPAAISSTPTQASSINSIMNFIYPNYQSQHHLNMDTGNVLESSASMSVAAAISGASATLADEPELKKVKLSHFHSYYQNQLFNDSLKQANLQHMSSKLMSSSAASSMSNNIYMVHKKLEERIGGILCCTVCLDLPQTVIYQVLIKLIINNHIYIIIFK